jgi:hypothetical protein
VYSSGDDRDWAVAAKGRARRLDRLVNDSDAFVATISYAIRRFRTTLRLSEIDVEAVIRQRTK